MHSYWPTRTLQTRLGTELPLLLAPMAGAGGVELALAVARAGGLAALPCALLDAETISNQVKRFRQQSTAPLNLNFFCHEKVTTNAAQQQHWLDRLAPYYERYGLQLRLPDALSASRASFDESLCACVELVQPDVVSFHFGVPDPQLFARVKASTGHVISSATSVAEAIHLAEAGCDMIIAQGSEAGGHRAMFLENQVEQQCGTLALVPQVVDAVDVPVIAAGGIADGRGIAAAFALGACGVQIGTAYLSSPEALTSALYREQLASSHSNSTVVSNVFTGKPARALHNELIEQLGALSEHVPDFPHAIDALLPLRKHAEALGEAGLSAFWAGQAAALSRNLPAEELTRVLATEALARLNWCQSNVLCAQKPIR